jgi:hypothetical protein
MAMMGDDIGERPRGLGIAAALALAIVVTALATATLLEGPSCISPIRPAPWTPSSTSAGFRT